jgi:2-amino-4-hydroxy-6-hydroxymethyldihydropteridine diphosphokinase
MKVILGLGTNVGDRVFYLRQAIATLRMQSILTDITPSPLYESDALLMPDAPEEWNMPFLNMAVAGTTLLDPDQLLTHIKALEQQLGRRLRGKWSPREIDIDILAYGDEVITSEHLTIPHSFLLDRSFALLPFADLWPDWRFPLPGPDYSKTATELAGNLPLGGIRKFELAQ